MLRKARPDPQLVIWPALAVVITGVALTLFANALRDELEQSARPSRRHRRATTVTTAEVAAAADPVRPDSDTIVHEELSSSASAPLLLHIESLAVGYPQADGSVTRVVDNVSLDIPRGEVHGLIGESGSGKTQTAWSVLRLLPAGGGDSGGIHPFERGGPQPGAEREDAGHTGRAHRLYPPGTHVQPRPVVHHRQPTDRADAD